MELILSIAFAVLGLWVLWIWVRGTRVPVVDGNFERLLREIDLAAMQNLMSPAEDDFLRRALPNADYRQVERARVKALLEYVAAISWNAALFMRAAAALQRNPDQQVAVAAATISRQALDLRLLSLAAQAALYLRLLLPGVKLAPFGIAGAYVELRGQMTSAWRRQSLLAA